MPFEETVDRESERAEIDVYLGNRPSPVVDRVFSDQPGRVPTGPARGWRARQRKAESCDRCEGDLWVEAPDGSQVPCDCRRRRAEGRARNRLRAGDWWRGSSLSFAAPPLAQVPSGVAADIERLCGAVLAGEGGHSLWLVGDEGQSKSALCAYLGQRLFPAGKVAVEHLGDLLAHLRWLGAVRGEGAVEEKLAKLAHVPLLVIDDLDRPVRSFPVTTALAMRESASSRDLLRLYELLDERVSSALPFVVTSRVEPGRCAENVTSINRVDLVRALVATASGTADPIEDFPSYTLDLISKAVDQLQEACRLVQLSSERRLDQAA
ncbi:MAG TPA: hypothetical protein VN522_08695 [Solirubrobacterales bacterium]|nr:hypothetical protein [Solirubrobacterales bacterium]